MKGNIIACWAARLSGALLILSVVPHYFFALPARVLQPVADGRVDADLGKTYYAVWVFASLTIILTGASFIYVSGDLKKGEAKAWWMTLLLSGGLTLYGAYINLKYPEHTHNLSFLIFGLITLLPLLIVSRKFVSSR
jgi:FtsH-binding integral membrane protein